MFDRKLNITGKITKEEEALQSNELDRLVDELKKGSAEAFSILYKKYHQKIYRYCLRMLGRESLAKDAFQETFIRVFEHKKDFRGSNFQAWLFTISRHTCLNILRSKKEYDCYDDELHGSQKSTASYQNQMDFGMQNYINNAIEKLPISLREALILREYQDLSYQEIADILNIDISLAKVRVHRARNILKKLLKPLVRELYEC